MYQLIRFYQNRDTPNRTLDTGLTLAQVQKHCSSLDSSSTTCTTKVGKARTRKLGPWFDGWTEMPEHKIRRSSPPKIRNLY
jgi:hypothetical protein